MRSAKTTSQLALSRSGRRPTRRPRPYADAIRLQEELGGGSAGDPQCLTDLAIAHNNLGLLQSETADAAGAEASFAAAIRLQERLLAAEPDNPERLRNLATTLNNLGRPARRAGASQLIELYQKAASSLKKAWPSGRDGLDYRSDLALTYNNLGGVQSRIGARPRRPSPTPSRWKSRANWCTRRRRGNRTRTRWPSAATTSA